MKTLRFTVPVELQAAAADGKRPSFSIVGYTGAQMIVGGFQHPVTVDLSGVTTQRDQIPILLDHDPSQIVGQGSVEVTEAGIEISGIITGEDAPAQKVMTHAKNGFNWNASIGADIVRREFVEAGKKATVNGREVVGPHIIARESLLSETSFVAIGADQKTSAAVAASHVTGKGTAMNFDQWLQAKGFDPAALSEAQKLILKKAFATEEETDKDDDEEEMPAKKAKSKGRVGVKASRVEDILSAARSESERQQQIADLTASFIAESPVCDADFIAKIEALASLAIEAKWSAEKYDTELLRASRPQFNAFRSSATGGRDKVTNRVIEAAVCVAGRLDGHEKMFDDQTLQAAHDKFKSGIGLKQLFLLCAESNGYRGNYASDVTLEAQRAAFGMVGPNRIQASGWSSLVISTILSNVANKFLRDGWNAVDMTPLNISAIRSVRDFKTVTTVSLTGDLMFEELGAAGEIKHGTLGEKSYSNKADTYAKMLAITRQDIINDDLGALTAVPRRMGRGAGLKLNDLFWTVFLAAEAGGFFASGNSNINTGVADMTVGGLEATETIFLNQTDPNGKPLGVQPKIILVPTALKGKATTLMTSERLITGASATLGDNNIWKDRFRVESSPYMSNNSYSGYSAQEWYMLADPNELPVIEIAALNGRVEPTVETADADFNVLGVQMRGYSDIGVALQEYRGGVLADGNAS